MTPILLPEKTNKTTNKESTTNENSFISEHNSYTYFKSTDNGIRIGCDRTTYIKMLPHFLLSVYLVYNYIKQAMFQKFFKIFFEKINTIARLKFFVYVLRPLGLFTWTSFRMNVTLSLFNFFAFLYLYLQICFLWGKINFCIFLNNCFK